MAENKEGLLPQIRVLSLELLEDSRFLNVTDKAGAEKCRKMIKTCEDHLKTLNEALKDATNKRLVERTIVTLGAANSKYAKVIAIYDAITALQAEKDKSLASKRAKNATTLADKHAKEKVERAK